MVLAPHFKLPKKFLSNVSSCIYSLRTISKVQSDQLRWPPMLYRPRFSRLALPCPDILSISPSSARTSFHAFCVQPLYCLLVGGLCSDVAAPGVGTTFEPGQAGWGICSTSTSWALGSAALCLFFPIATSAGITRHISAWVRWSVKGYNMVGYVVGILGLEVLNVCCCLWRSRKLDFH